MKLRTQMMMGYLIVFAAMVGMITMMYQTNQTLLEAQQRVDQAHEVQTKARLVQKLVVDMQAGKRGYLITGKDEYLQPYTAAREAYDREMRTLRNLVSDNPRQIQRLEDVETLVTRWQQTVAIPQIEKQRQVLAGTAALDEVVTMLESEAGERLIDDMREKLNAFVSTEGDLLAARENAARAAAGRSLLIALVGISLAIAIGIAAMLLVTRSVLGRVGGEPAEIAGITDQIAKGNLDIEIEDGTGIRASVATMVQALRRTRERTESQDWLKTGIARLNEVMSGDPEIGTLAARVVSEISSYLEAQVGAFYLAQSEDGLMLRLLASYAYRKRKNLSNEFKAGEGLVGQAALEKQQILVSNVPEDYIKVTSGLGEHTPRFICVTPFLYEGRVKGVIEIATLNQMDEAQMEYLRQAMDTLAVAVESAQGRTQLTRTLRESQQLSEELQTQQEELKAVNEELEEQTQRLQQSEERLKSQQEEMEVTNEELEEKNDLLERQKKQVDQARKDIEEKAEELALASKYKSQFLANMSHELRTPLNSLLLLAQALAQNKEGNLSDEQVESAKIIQGSGNDLLNLINEILDLSKIEAGHMELKTTRIPMSELADGVRASFQHMAAEKGLTFEVSVEDDAPKEITSDRTRVEQVIRNLVSNAVKFTEKGGVTVRFGRPEPDTDLSRSGLDPGETLAVAVEDTGIGLAPAQQKIIFEAFQQVDAGTTRTYGGTGLGLSISRELLRLLGGEIKLQSEPGRGSVFTVYLPTRHKPERKPESEPKQTKPVPNTSPPVWASVEDDRDRITESDSVVLVIEDDPRFAGVVRDRCHDRGLKCLVVPTGESGLEMVKERVPDAVILDIRLPGMDGWAVLAALKDDIRTRHVPVHIISVEESSTESFRRGAVGHATKPITREDLDEAFRKLRQVSAGEPKRVLVVEDDAGQRRETVELIGNGDVQVDEAGTGAEALEALRSRRYDCVVLDLHLPDMDGDRVLATLEEEDMPLPPVIVHTARDLTREEEIRLRERAESIVVKDVRSPERLLDEVSLFLHRLVSRMPQKQRKIIRDLHDTDELLRDKKVLVVDDDMRTSFAISHLLSGRGMKPLKAQNGARALKLLKDNPDVALVLMDIMMPVMDGYEAMKRIRESEETRRIPIIALTAKAMPQDRGKCLAAGADDYMPKPVDEARLISMMRVWLHR